MDDKQREKTMNKVASYKIEVKHSSTQRVRDIFYEEISHGSKIEFSESRWFFSRIFKISGDELDVTKAMSRVMHYLQFIDESKYDLIIKPETNRYR